MRKIIKRSLSLLLALCMVLAMLPAAAPIVANAAEGEGTTYYFDPHSIHQGNERYAVYIWNDSGSQWIDMTDEDGDGVYQFVLPADYTNLIFCRMNGSNLENSWDTIWNQTSDLSGQTDGKNCYVATGYEGDQISGEWTIYAYTVAGSETLCGTNWDTANTANDMTYADGVWTKTYTNVAAGDYEFKVALNHTWSVAYPSSNVSVNMETAGCLKVTFDPSTKEVSYIVGHSYETVVTNPTCTEGGYTTHTCAICGDSYTDSETEAAGHSYVDGTCTVCGGADPDYTAPSTSGYMLVTDVKDIQAGGQFVIVANNSGEYLALTTSLSSSKFVPVVVTVSDNVVTGEDLPVWTIETATDGVYLRTGDNYLNYKSGTDFKFATTAYTWSVTAGANGGFVFNSAATTRGIYYQISVGKFGAYAKSNASNSGYISELLVFKYVESGAPEGCDHSYEAVVTAPTCTEGGYTTYTCSKCDDSYTGDETKATGHTYVDGSCTVCGDKETTYAGRYYIATIRSSGNYFYMTNDLGTASTKRYQAADTGLTTLPAEIASPEADKIFVLEKNADGTYSIYAEGIEEDAKYLGWTSGNSGKLVAQASALKLTVEVTEDGLYNIHFTASDAERYLALNDNTGNDYFAWYKSGQKQDLSLIPVTGEVVKTYTLTIDISGTKTDYELAYGEALPEITVDPIVTENGKYTFCYWEDLDAENIARVDELPATMPAKNLNYEAEYTYVGWVDNDGARQFRSGDMMLSGWWCINADNEIVTDGSGDWYYFDTDTYNAATGITRVPYPNEAINGITYDPNAEDLKYCEDKGISFVDAESSLFVFDEDGKFNQRTGAIYNEDNSAVLHYAINGQLPWHIGLVQVGSHIYYFIGENEKATGDVYVSRSVNVSSAVMGGIYTFGEDGSLCRNDGITKMADGTVRYYDNGQLMIGAGLVKLEDGNYIYVRATGELVVDAEYYIPANDLGVVPGTYTFDENGYMVDPAPTDKNGFYYEDGSWFYYVNGVKGYCAGLISTDGIKWYETADAEGFENSGWVYVKSNGALVCGTTYYVTNVNDHATIVSGDKCVFGADCLMQVAKNGIVDGYYYENNKIVCNAGLIQIDGSYYYVRSNGQVVMGRTYWITNTNGLKAAGFYEFGADGKMVVSEKNGIVDGCYYVDGIKQIGTGLTKLEDGSYIYVRSNGELATGMYWITNHNDLLEEGEYDFGEDGILVIG